jgi:hypothetical protein
MIKKQIKGFPNYYVSDCGKIISKKFNKERILKTAKNKWGYLYVSITNGKKYYSKTVHRLVADTFKENKIKNLEVNHIDGNKLNNNIKNLEWITKSENCKHKYRVLGIKQNTPLLNKKGKDCPHSKKVSQFDKKNNLIKIWDSIADVQRELKYNGGRISAVCLGKRKTHKGFIWRHLK